MAAANPERGEIDLKVGDRAFVLKLSMNAAVALEKKTGMSIGQINAAAATLHFEAIRSLFWLMLQKHHAKEFETEESVGDLIDDAGGVAVIFDLMISLANGNAPEPGEEAAGAGDGANPPTAQAGTGERSTSTPVASA